MSKGRLVAVMIAVPVAVAVLAAMGLNRLVSSFLIRQAKEEIQSVLLTHRGMHHYIQQVMHPAYYKARDLGEIEKEFYDPKMLSSTYIVRNTHKFYNDERLSANLPEVYYKMAANNPRNPVNKADDREERLITLFNADRTQKEFEEVVEKDGKKYLYYAIPFLQNEERCMKCHGKRQDAPPKLQALYPGEGGFNERAGQIRAIESVRVPLERELYEGYVATGSGTAGLMALFALIAFNTRLRGSVRAKTAHLEAEIIERTKAEKTLQCALVEKEVLLKEIHHRVKNNMQVISSLMSLQTRYIADETQKEVFKESQSRIQSMALVHERLYQSRELSRVSLKDYIPALATTIRHSFAPEDKELALTLNVDDLLMSPDVLIPCGLILNELLTNAYKHAFKGRTKGTITVVMRTLDGVKARLDVSDDGVGLPKGTSLKDYPALGLKLVETLTEQIDGALEVKTGATGTTYSITFPINQVTSS